MRPAKRRMRQRSCVTRRGGSEDSKWVPDLRPGAPPSSSKSIGMTEGVARIETPPERRISEVIKPICYSTNIIILFQLVGVETQNLH